MIRTFNADVMNEIANRPGIKEAAEFKSDQKAYLDPLINNTDNFAFQDEEGGFIFVKVGHQTYEVHTLLSENCRGVVARKKAEDVIERMFIETDCESIITNTKDRKTKIFCTAFFSSVANRDDRAYFELTLDEYGNRSRKGYKGLALSMAENGNLLKAHAMYNRWAIKTGRPTMFLHSAIPPVFEIGPDTYVIENKEVVLCQSQQQ